MSTSACHRSVVRRLRALWFVALALLLVATMVPQSVLGELDFLAARSAGALVVYEFAEGGGSTVGDSSGVGAPLDLTIRDPGSVSWGPDGLTVSSAVVSTDGPATKVIDAVTLSGELTVEAWVTPANVTQDGPARIVANAPDPFSRNFMLGQGMYGRHPDDVFSMRFRTSSNVSGTPELHTPAGTASTALTHVVMTRAVDGTQTLYVDGTTQATSTVSGDTSNWDPSFPLVLGNVDDGTRPWSGTFCLIALYDRALIASEVSDNHAAGCRSGDPTNSPPVLDPIGDQTSTVGAAVTVPVSASDADGDALTFSAVGLPDGLGIDPAAGDISGTPTTAGTSTVTVTVDDGQASDSETLTWTVTDGANSPPVAVDDSYLTAPDALLAVGPEQGVLSNDSDGDQDPLEAVLVGGVIHGDLTLRADGSFDYQPNPGFSGDDAFTYEATDGTATSTATARIRVSSDDQPPRLVTGTVGFTKRIVDDTVDETHAVVGGDLDGDGDIDLAATDFVDDTVHWYEDTGDGTYLQRALDPGLDGAYPIHAADVDLDGDLDILAAGYLADTVVWYENDSAARFIRHDVDTAADGAHSVVTADLDGDGDTDLVTTNQDADTVTWYENDGTLGFTLRTIDRAANGAKRAEVADLDGDGDLDVAAASFFADEVAWYENDGSQAFTKHVVDDRADGAYYVFPGDLDADGDADLLSASQLDDTVAWHRNDGAGGFTEVVLDPSADGARTVIAHDLDRDGDLDALAASVNDDTIAWFENDGTGGFTAHVIDSAADGAYGIATVDVDHDGDVDVLSASRDADAVAIHAQDRFHEATMSIGDTLLIETSLLQTVDPDDDPADLVYTLTTAPAYGTLQAAGRTLGVGGTFTQQDVDSGAVSYVHGGQTSAQDELSFTVSDRGQQAQASGRYRFTIVSPDDFVVHLPMDDGSGTVATDASAHGHDGTLVGGAIYEAGSADGSPYCVRFDGVDDRVDIEPVDVEGSGLTIAAWFNADAFPGPSRDPRIVSKASGVAADDHVFMLSTIASGSQTRLRARVRTNGRTTTLIATSGDLSTGTWHHATATYDGGALRLYLDGHEVGSTPLSGTVDVDRQMPVSIGGQPPGAGSRFFNGRVDDVRILQRALAPSEIADILAAAEGS